MGKKTKIWLVVAGVLVVVGLILFAAVMMVYDWNFTKLSTVKYETNTYVAEGAFSNLILYTDTADITLVKTEDRKCKVVCYEPDNGKHSVTVQNGTLTINENDQRKWYEYIDITVDTPKITVYLSEEEYETLTIRASTGDIVIPKEFRFETIDILTSTGDVTNHASGAKTIQIKTSTGDIFVENVSAGVLMLSVSTGKVTVTDATCESDFQITVSTGKANVNQAQCKNFISNGDTGDITLKNVIAREKLSVERSTGDVKLDGCNGAEILINTDTGDVTGSLLSEKVFLTETDTGDVMVPKTTTGGICQITTNTGDIKITVN